MQHSLDTKLAQNLLLILNIGLLLAISYYAFSRNENFLFYGLDGSYMMTLVTQQFKWGLSSAYGFTNNIFQSNGNIFFPINSSLIPAYFTSLKLHSGELNRVTSYVIFALEIFTAIYIYSINFKYKPIVAFMAGWSFLLIAYPFFGLPPVYVFFTLVPHCSTAIAETLITMVLMSKITSSSKFYYWVYTTVIFLLVAHGLVAYPSAAMLTAPLLAAFAFSCLLIANKTGILRFLVSMLIIFLLLFAFGFIHYFFGLFKYTAAVLFINDLLVSRADWYNTSIFFHYKSSYLSIIYMFATGMFGAILDSFNKNLARKIFARVFIVYVIAIFTFGTLIIYLYPGWQGPVPLYYEIIIWPLYCIYASYAIYCTCKAINALAMSKFKLDLASLQVFLPIILVCTIFFIVKKHPFVNKDITYTYPPKYPTMVELLRNEVGLSPFSQFRGRVANFIGQNLGSATWFDLHTRDNNHMLRVGNELRLVGLNYYDIPSLFEYSPLLTPSFYGFTKKFFANRNDKQMRNAMALRNPNPTMLRLLGVKFFVTDALIGTEAKLRFSMPDQSLYLYELEQVNTGQYSPTNVILEDTAKSALEFMSESNFNPEQTVVVHKKVNDTLVGAHNATMQIEQDGYISILAESTGTSLLVLPLEFSHCFDIFNEDENSNLQIFRVNVLQTGVVFTGHAKFKMRYFTGPMHNASCRLKDLTDMQDLKIIAVTE